MLSFHRAQMGFPAVAAGINYKEQNKKQFKGKPEGKYTGNPVNGSLKRAICKLPTEYRTNND